MGQNTDLVCYSKKQSFRHGQYKSPVMPKVRALGNQEKSENFNSLKPILFELCKQTTGGIGLRIPRKFSISQLLTFWQSVGNLFFSILGDVSLFKNVAPSNQDTISILSLFFSIFWRPKWMILNVDFKRSISVIIHH